MNDTLRQKLINSFYKNFGELPITTYKAPGRINLIGEHTDYNGGYVLPCAINAFTYLALGPSLDGKFHAISENYPETKSSWYPSEKQKHDNKAPWANYLIGLTAEFVKQGYPLKPMQLAFTSEVPTGCGLSSSAALQMSFAKAMSDLNHLGLEPTVLANLARISENNFVGSQCGIMDQLISLTAKKNCASLIDCSTLSWQHISLNPDWKLLVVHSGIKRELKASAFNQRFRECAQIKKTLDLKSLKETTLKAIKNNKNSLGDLLYRRAHHIISENKRVLELSKNISKLNSSHISRLMSDSHMSMDQNFEITTPQINKIFNLIKRLLKESGGVRMTGGGFGGCLVVLCGESNVEPIKELISDTYNKINTPKAQVFQFESAEGASVLVPAQA